MKLSNTITFGVHYDLPEFSDDDLRLEFVVEFVDATDQLLKNNEVSHDRA